MRKIEGYELDILAAYGRGEFKSIATKAELAKFRAAARATAIEDSPMNLRPLSGKRVRKRTK